MPHLLLFEKFLLLLLHMCIYVYICIHIRMLYVYTLEKFYLVVLVV